MLQGRHEPGFERLAQTLASILERTRGGAGLCVYVDGRPVFDMWGGEKDPAGAAWERDTSSVSFSTTKGVASTALHILADRGLLDYEAPVAHYWPEFGQNGKQSVTLADVMTHRAGLFDVRSLVVHADTLLDWDAMVQTLARAPMSHAPGQKHAYHALTYGHLVGEVVRRVSGRPFSRFVREEIAEPLGLEDFWIGAPPEAIAKAARLIGGSRQPASSAEEQARRAQKRQAKARRYRRNFQMAQRALKLAGLPMDSERIRGAFSPRGIERWDFSEPRVLSACIPAVNGLFTARDLARMYACLALDGELEGARLMSSESVRRVTRVRASGPDSVLVFPMGWRLGYHGVPTSVGFPRRAFGHFGYGGSGAWADPEQRMSLGYVVNAGVGTPVGDWRIIKLGGVALSCARAYRRRRAA